MHIERSEVPGYVVEILSKLQSLDARMEQLNAMLQSRRKDHYTVAEFANLVGRSAYTVRRWVDDGKIQAIRVQGTGPRGRLLIARGELERLVHGGQGGDVPASALG